MFLGWGGAKARAGRGVGVIVEVLGYTGAVWAIHADGVDFVEEGDGAVFVGEVADLFDGSDGAAHAVDGFKGDDLGDFWREACQFGFKVDEVVMFEYHLLGARVSDSLDHRSVVHAIA